MAVEADLPSEDVEPELGVAAGASEDELDRALEVMLDALEHWNEVEMAVVYAQAEGDAAKLREIDCESERAVEAVAEDADRMRLTLREKLLAAAREGGAADAKIAELAERVDDAYPDPRADLRRQLERARARARSFVAVRLVAVRPEREPLPALLLARARRARTRRASTRRARAPAASDPSSPSGRPAPPRLTRRASPSRLFPWRSGRSRAQPRRSLETRQQARHLVGGGA